MKKIFILLLIATFLMTVIEPSMAQRNNSYSTLLRSGLLGAGAGAIGGAASGAKGDDIWKGALAGVGVNIIGGALLDAISGERVQQERTVQTMPTRDAYSQGYQDGYYNGYKAGYTEGYKEGIKEALREAAASH